MNFNLYWQRIELPHSLSALLCCAVTAGVGAFSVLTPTPANATYQNSCSLTATYLYQACRYDYRDNSLTAHAICLNLSGVEERAECRKDARIDLRESSRSCRDIRHERLDLCDLIGESRYDPPFGEDFVDNFIDPLEIGSSVAPNPYFPLVPGNKWVYQSIQVNDEGESVTETVTVSVTDKTKNIQGVTCLVVKDVVDEDGSVIEDTDDWFAQDTDGNVWYCGEIALNFETFDGDNPEEPEVTDIDGSWKAGVDGSKAGILFPLNPVVGEIIRQEVAWVEAEDVIEILSTTGSESAPGGSCSNNCLVTRDFTPLDPGVNEQKFYAPGVGLILELDADGNRVELISFQSM